MDVPGHRGNALRLVPLHHGDGGVGALQGPHSHAKILHVAEAARGGGSLWVSNCLLVWSIFDLGDGEGVLD